MTTPAAHNPPVGDPIVAAGIHVTEEGKRRARARLDEFDRRWTPQQWNALAEQIGAPPRYPA